MTAIFSLRYEWSVNPRGVVYFMWSTITSAACLYNLLAVTMLVFEDVRESYFDEWKFMNTVADGIYFLDMLVHSRVCKF